MNKSGPDHVLYLTESQRSLLLDSIEKKEIINVSASGSTVKQKSKDGKVAKEHMTSVRGDGVLAKGQSTSVRDDDVLKGLTADKHVSTIALKKFLHELQETILKKDSGNLGEKFRYNFDQLKSYNEKETFIAEFKKAFEIFIASKLLWDVIVEQLHDDIDTQRSSGVENLLDDTQVRPAYAEGKFLSTLTTDVTKRKINTKATTLLRNQALQLEKLIHKEGPVQAATLLNRISGLRNLTQKYKNLTEDNWVTKTFGNRFVVEGGQVKLNPQRLRRYTYKIRMDFFDQKLDKQKKIIELLHNYRYFMIKDKVRPTYMKVWFPSKDGLLSPQLCAANFALQGYFFGYTSYHEHDKVVNIASLKNYLNKYFRKSLEAVEASGDIINRYNELELFNLEKFFDLMRGIIVYTNGNYTAYHRRDSKWWTFDGEQLISDKTISISTQTRSKVILIFVKQDMRHKETVYKLCNLCRKQADIKMSQPPEGEKKCSELIRQDIHDPNIHFWTQNPGDATCGACAANNATQDTIFTSNCFNVNVKSYYLSKMINNKSVVYESLPVNLKNLKDDDQLHQLLEYLVAIILWTPPPQAHWKTIRKVGTSWYLLDSATTAPKEIHIVKDFLKKHILSKERLVHTDEIIVFKRTDLKSVFENVKDILYVEGYNTSVSEPIEVQ